jgi:transcriptional/translational regulatory protein YebC/TACO1
MAEAGAVSWQFKRAAYFALPAEGADADRVFELAVEAGADDVITGEDDIEILAPVEAFKHISDQLEAAGIKPAEATLRHVPKATIELTPDQTVQVMRVVDGQEVFSNLHISDAAVEMLEAA